MSPLSISEQVEAAYSIERLEYGKPCVSPDGPIVAGSGHRQLACSPGFPEALLSHCYPSEIGLPESLLREHESHGFPHISVLRPNRISQAFPVIFCQARFRPEDGENGQERRFGMARFSVSAAAVEPLALYLAVASAPFVPLTVGELGTSSEGAVACPPILRPWKVNTSPENSSGISRVTEQFGASFVDSLCQYTLSGIPIVLEGFMPSADFYAIVDLLWRRLPSEIRPLLSAGWGTPEALLGEFSISVSSHGTKNAAVYSLRDKTWVPPDTIVGWTPFGPTTVPFRYETLENGLAAAVPNSLTKIEDRLTVYLAPYKSELAALPKFSDGMVQRCFQIPGEFLLDAKRLSRLKGWAVSKSPSSDFEARWLDFQFPSFAFAAVEWIAEALAHPELAQTAQDGLAKLLSGVHRESAIKARPVGLTNGRLICALLIDLSLKDHAAILRSYAAVAESDVALDLSANMRGILFAALDWGLQASAQELREQVASVLDHPLRGEFTQWLATGSNAFRLAATCGFTAPEHVDRIRSIIDKYDSPEISVLRRWFDRESPDGCEDTVDRMGPIEHGLICRGIEAAWRDPAGERSLARERILPWACMFHRSPDATLQLALDHSHWLQRGKTQIESLFSEATRGGIPPSLRAKVAALAVYRWDLANPHRDEPAWTPILAHLNPADRDLLGLPKLDPRDVPAPQAERVFPSYPALELLIHGWAKAGSQGMASLRRCIKEWLVGNPEADTFFGRAAVCRGYLADDVPAITSADEEALRDCSSLLRTLLPAEGAQRYWKMSRETWQIRVTLETFRDGTPQPDERQGCLLIQDRKWLAGHLRQNAANSVRNELLQIYTREFQSIKYPGSGAFAWKDAYRGSPYLWAMFRNLPLERQGFLPKAIECFAASDDPQAQAELYLTYLAVAPNNERIVERVIVGFLVYIPFLEQWMQGEYQQAEVRFGKTSATMSLKGKFLRTHPITIQDWQASVLRRVSGSVSLETWNKAFALSKQMR